MVLFSNQINPQNRFIHQSQKPYVHTNIVRNEFTQQRPKTSSVALHVTPCSVMDLYQYVGLPLRLGIFTLILQAASSYKHWNLSMKMQCVFTT